jgi:hypothetical protein
MHIKPKEVCLKTCTDISQSRSCGISLGTLIVSHTHCVLSHWADSSRRRCVRRARRAWHQTAVLEIGGECLREIKGNGPFCRLQIKVRKKEWRKKIILWLSFFFFWEYFQPRIIFPSFFVFLTFICPNFFHISNLFSPRLLCFLTNKSDE